MTVGEGREVQLVRALERLHPNFRQPLQEINARVYDLSLSGEPSVQLMNRMYVSFLHSLCGSEYQVFVHHIVPGMKGEALADLVRRLERLEPSTQLTVLSKQDVRRMGFRARGAPYRELTLATRTRETLEILFEYGYMYIGFEEWLLGRVDSAFPLEFLRRTCFEREVTALLQSAVRDFPATIQIREFHGPLVATTYLSEERVFSAANQTASELGYILRVE